MLGEQSDFPHIYSIANLSSHVKSQHYHYYQFSETNLKLCMMRRYKMRRKSVLFAKKAMFFVARLATVKKMISAI